MLAVCDRLFADTKIGVHVLVWVFAISSWVDMYGLWMELPVFVTYLPERWNLPSYIIILTQIANIGPIIFLLLAFCLKKTSVSKLTLQKVASYIIMVVGLTSTLLLAFLWRRTHYFLSSERSLAVLTLSFLLSLMDCTSSLAYITFMGALKPAYMPSYFVGEGLSGFLPAMMGLAQGAGDVTCVNGSSTREERNATTGQAVNVTSYFLFPSYTPPRFSVQVFFILLSAMIAMSIVAFSLLNYWGYCQDQFVSDDLQEDLDPLKEGRKLGKEPVCGAINPTFSAGRDKEEVPGLDKDFTILRKVSSTSKPGSEFGRMDPDRGSQDYMSSDVPGQMTLEEGWEGRDLSTMTVVFLMVQVAILNFLIHGFLLSVQVYSSLPFGISVYNLVVTLTSIAIPMACLTSFFLAVTSPLGITVLTSLGCAFGAYIIVEAIMSPSPPLVDDPAGGPVAVMVWVFGAFFLTYARVSIASVMRRVGHRALLCYGALTQLGALIGAAIGFVLVNEAKVFKDAPWC